jgi:hypothetical protein
METMGTEYYGIGMVIDKQCPWCANTRILVTRNERKVRLRCTMNGKAPTRKLPYCGCDAELQFRELTPEERVLYKAYAREKKTNLGDC